MNLKIFNILLFSVLLILVKGYSQEIPPIQGFNYTDYGAEDQNWAITQDDALAIYVANNKGLLRYDGARWTLYPSPNGSILRSVNFINGKIYTGGYMEFGYWVKDEFGVMNYSSISNTLSIQLKEDEEFWNIISLEDNLIFQSLSRIYIYDTATEQVEVIESDTKITKLFKVGNTIYYQKFAQGIFKLINGAETLVESLNLLRDFVFINILETEQGILIHTKENGFYLLKNEQLTKINGVIGELLEDKSLYNSLKLRDGSILLGTVSKGLIQIDANGTIINVFNQDNGLSNNTVLALFEDAFGNVWLGLDNGINVINFNAAVKEFNDNLGLLGTVYTSAIYKGKLYLGTNQGLFSKPLNREGRFKLEEKTNGQVWGLSVYQNLLVCSHDKGTFVIDGNSIQRISGPEGTWKVIPVMNSERYYLQGNYDGLYVLDLSQRKILHKIEGFEISSRFFEFVNETQLLVSHEHKGVLKLKLDQGLNTVIEVETDSQYKGIKSSLVKFRNQIYFANKNGVYRFDAPKNDFLQEPELTKILANTNYVSGKMLTTEVSNKLWFFTENNLTNVAFSNISSSLIQESIPLKSSIRKTKDGYENILELGQHKYLIGTTEGYIVVDEKAFKPIEYPLSFEKITYYKLNQAVSNLPLNETLELQNKENNIHFNFSVPNFNKYFPVYYKYRLLNFNEAWSEWSEDAVAHFENLPHGQYKLEVKSKVGQQENQEVLTYEFIIKKPYYLTHVAIIIYGILFILIVFLIHNIYKAYYKAQKQKLIQEKERELEFKQMENQKQFMHYKNQNLQQNIENKNRELGISTMNIIKKNELLNDIKVELNKADSLDKVKKVVKLIDKNLKDSNDWKMFEEAFNNADKDFLKKIKSLHPSLTSNDLRLCAYLRLNLSSKEIAPLLNITPRSVEVKRYRLRKKLNLEHDDSLASYILEI